MPRLLSADPRQLELEPSHGTLFDDLAEVVQCRPDARLDRSRDRPESNI